MFAGVTYIGARDQIHRQLKSSEDHGTLDLYPWANYLARVVRALFLVATPAPSLMMLLIQ